MERLNFETLFRIVRWDYNRCFKDESLDKDLFMGKYGKVMGEHYYPIRRKRTSFRNQ